MRYAKGSFVVNSERDVPLLRQIRNSKFISHRQLFEFMKLGGLDHSRNSFNWRLKRLLNAGQISLCQPIYGADSSVYCISKGGLSLLEHYGHFSTALNSDCAHLPHASLIFHALELNAIQLALARSNTLAAWQCELEIASFNIFSQRPYAKDYDALVDVWFGERRARFALEYERTLKGAKHYEQIRAALEAELQVDCILYLTSSAEMLFHLAREFQYVRKKLAFAAVGPFEKDLLDTFVTSLGTSIRFSDLLQI